MKPHEFDMQILGRTADSVQVKVTATIVTHRCPLAGSEITPCCERTPFELPRWHRMTTDQARVTCQAGTDA